MTVEQEIAQNALQMFEKDATAVTRTNWRTGYQCFIHIHTLGFLNTLHVPFFGSLLISKSKNEHCLERNLDASERSPWQGWQGADGSYCRQAGDNHDVIMRTGMRTYEGTMMT